MIAERERERVLRLLWRNRHRCHRGRERERERNIGGQIEAAVSHKMGDCLVQRPAVKQERHDSSECWTEAHLVEKQMVDTAVFGLAACHQRKRTSKTLMQVRPGDQPGYPKDTIESFVGRSSMGLLCPPAKIYQR